MIVYPRQKVYGFSFLRQLKTIFLKKNINPVDCIKNLLELDNKYKINFVYKARIGFFHILKYLHKKIN